jgi:hypothetical protein
MPTWSRPGMDVPPEVRRKFVRRITLKGLKLKVELLPSLWLKAPFYGIMISHPTEGTVHFKIDRPYAKATKADFDRLLSRVRVDPCAVCRKPFLVGDDTPTENPRRLCRRHWYEDIVGQGKKERIESEARAARDDAKARKRGLRYKAYVWIHGDGDDFSVVTYFASKPTKAQLEKIARSRKSMILDDYGVERLKDVP